jgi:drug/metabolite transporter superfamily protein YnfA
MRERRPAVVIGLAALATAYCFWIWMRKGECRNSWIAFLATATSALILVTLPSVVATSLALINAVNHLPIQ